MLLSFVLMVVGLLMMLVACIVKDKGRHITVSLIVLMVGIVVMFSGVASVSIGAGAILSNPWKMLSN